MRRPKQRRKDLRGLGLPTYWESLVQSQTHPLMLGIYSMAAGASVVEFWPASVWLACLFAYGGLALVVIGIRDLRRDPW